jgi:hypothetical protein
MGNLKQEMKEKEQAGSLSRLERGSAAPAGSGVPVPAMVS